MSGNPRDHSIESEPHLRHCGFTPDPSEAKADHILARESNNESDQVEHTVWDEPALSKSLAGEAPPDALTYARWLEARRLETGLARSWVITLAVALIAGPWAVLASLLGTEDTAFGIATITVFGPVIEELSKAHAALWIVEKRPFLFRSRLQIVICSLASGLVFAGIENVLVLYVRIPNPAPELVAWRWTVCVAMHAGCTLIASMGLIRIWAQTMKVSTKPDVVSGAKYLTVAMLIHGLYNTFVIVFATVNRTM